MLLNPEVRRMAVNFLMQKNGPVLVEKSTLDSPFAQNVDGQFLTLREWTEVVQTQGEDAVFYPWDLPRELYVERLALNPEALAGKGVVAGGVVFSPTRIILGLRGGDAAMDVFLNAALRLDALLAVAAVAGRLEERVPTA